jgi:carboxylesterase type B
MAGPALEEEARKGNADLNVGLHDQRTALRWVQRVSEGR